MNKKAFIGLTFIALSSIVLAISERAAAGLDSIEASGRKEGLTVTCGKREDAQLSSDGELSDVITAFVQDKLEWKISYGGTLVDDPEVIGLILDSDPSDPEAYGFAVVTPDRVIAWESCNVK